MFKRVQFEEWQAIITLVAFIVFFIAFLYFCWRALRMSKRDRDHMSNLPLESGNPEDPSNEQERESTRR
jgi:cbb3-type cytochrome oxidase subunit 3